MKVGILGLGLIGGSLARAYALEGHTVYAAEANESMLSFAMLAGAVHGRLENSTIPQCDLILLAIYPDGSATWLEENARFVSPDTLVLDCCGILILWLFLLPLFIRKETVVFSRRKMNWLLYSAITHFFVLVINLAESVCLLASDAEQAETLLRL